ncbi:MAG: alkaline phosphatase, partial [Caulobacteraceae bacterium]
MLALRIAALAAALATQATAASLPAAQTTDPYFQSGRAALARELAVKRNTRPAKNVILFLGDGMGGSTITAARIFEGQQAGRDGASNSLAFETLPYAALSKTYSNDGLVTDSAAGIHAILTGTKTNNGVLGLTDTVKYGDCAGSAGHEVASLMELAKQRGLSTGAITTTRLTHAT